MPINVVKWKKIPLGWFCGCMFVLIWMCKDIYCMIYLFVWHCAEHNLDFCLRHVIFHLLCKDFWNSGTQFWERLHLNNYIEFPKIYQHSNMMNEIWLRNKPYYRCFSIEQAQCKGMAFSIKFSFCITHSKPEVIRFDRIWVCFEFKENIFKHIVWRVFLNLGVLIISFNLT